MSNPIDQLLTGASDAIALAQRARFGGRHADAETSIHTARAVINALCDVIADQHVQVLRDPASLCLSDLKPTSVLKAHPRHVHAN